MFRRAAPLSFLLALTISLNAFAADLVIELNFPKASTAKITGQKRIPHAQSVSGQLIIDVAPYPPTAERDRYSVEYYLNNELLLDTTGFDAGAPGKLDFSCLLDTTKYENGVYKLIANFFDKKGRSAIGIQEIVINNVEINE